MGRPQLEDEGWEGEHKPRFLLGSTYEWGSSTVCCGFSVEISSDPALQVVVRRVSVGVREVETSPSIVCP